MRDRIKCKIRRVGLKVFVGVRRCTAFRDTEHYVILVSWIIDAFAYSERSVL